MSGGGSMVTLSSLASFDEDEEEGREALQRMNIIIKARRLPACLSFVLLGSCYQACICGVFHEHHHQGEAPACFVQGSGLLPVCSRVFFSGVCSRAVSLEGSPH
jgi:hypothetical protein